jgi:SAM-dependent methyltransferase
MSHDFDRDYWETHWHGVPDASSPGDEGAANPYIARESIGLTSGTALDAGCGTGAESVWLAGHGWRVTGVDISASALARAASRAAATGVRAAVTWIEADLTTWEPGAGFDLVTTNYAHPAIPQLDFYQRISAWVAPGGTLLIVGHLVGSSSTANGHHPPKEVTVTAASISARLDPAEWRIETADELERSVVAPDGATVHLCDVVVRATRLA